MHIRLAWPWEGPDGTTHKEGTFLKVPVDVGQDLVRRGLAAAFTPEESEAAIEAEQDPTPVEETVEVLYEPPTDPTEDTTVEAVTDAQDAPTDPTEPGPAEAGQATVTTDAPPAEATETRAGKTKPRPGPAVTTDATTTDKEA